MSAVVKLGELAATVDAQLAVAWKTGPEPADATAGCLSPAEAILAAARMYADEVAAEAVNAFAAAQRWRRS